MKQFYLLLLTTVLSVCGQYEASWTSLDTRPLPKWYDEAKIGIFLHWGVFSVPSFGSGAASEWFWAYWRGGTTANVDFMKDNYRPSMTYPDFAAELTTEFYDPDEWASIFKRAGAKYVVLTSKHHEGYTMWPSRYNFNWNALSLGAQKDLLGQLSTAVKAQNLTFGVYHSLYEWYNPLYLTDQKNNYQTDYFVKTKTMPELVELVERYEPEVIWSDGDWDADDWYWNSTTFISWLYNESPVKDTVVVNDRWGIGIPCNHGDFYTCTDRYNPGTLVGHKWENAMTIDKVSWGYRRNANLADLLTAKELIDTLVQTISCGGNLLVNVGPTKDGRIIPIFEERLTQMGEWLAVNGEAIYSSVPWTYQNDTLQTGVWYTQQVADDASYIVYAIVLFWPQSGSVTLGAPLTSSSTVITMLGYDQSQQLQFTDNGGNLQITFPLMSESLMDKHAWTLKMTNIAN